MKKYIEEFERISQHKHKPQQCVGLLSTSFVLQGLHSRLTQMHLLRQVRNPDLFFLYSPSERHNRATQASDTLMAANWSISDL